MAEQIKQWKDLTVLEQVKRSLLAEEGLVCGECGRPVSTIGTTIGCLK